MKIAILAAAAVSLGVGACAPDAVPTSGAVVKAMHGKGHGSAVHIGNGLYLTAAHVVRDDMRLVADNGDSAPAEILWASEKYDIALMRADIAGVDAVDLECRVPEFGEALELRGNPLSLEFVSTWARVAGASRTIGDMWAEGLPVDGALISGMSGGAALDLQGDLVGINVGTMIMPVRTAGGPAGIGIIVSGETICGLMGRLA